MHVARDGTGRTALEKRPHTVLIWPAESQLLKDPDIANPIPALEHLWLGKGPPELDHLEWKPGRREKGGLHQRCIRGARFDLIEDG